MEGSRLKDLVLSGNREGLSQYLLSSTACGDDADSILNWHDDSGKTALHHAAISGDLDIVQELLEAGAQWNALDNDNHTAAEYAANHDEIYQALVCAGVRTEALFIALGVTRDGADDEFESYLQSKVEYTDDGNKDGVMMAWESPLMKQHAELLSLGRESYLANHVTCDKQTDMDKRFDMVASRAATKAMLSDRCRSFAVHTVKSELRQIDSGKCILNVGFGMGIFDTYIQQYHPSLHVIIEAHPDVICQMKATGWDKKPGVRICEGKWQQVMAMLIEEGVVFDGIFFDTFGEYYEDMMEFHRYLPEILSENGIYSFFNGLCATRQVAHDVSCHLAVDDIESMGFTVEFVQYPLASIDDVDGQPGDVNVLDANLWDGVKRKYWTISMYRIPIVYVK